MSSYILRRLLLIVPTLLGMTMVVFFVMAFSPGGIGAALNEGELRPAERKAMQEYYNKRYGLDKPKVVQYGKWLNHVSFVGVKEASEGFPASWRLGFKLPDMGESRTKHRP